MVTSTPSDDHPGPLGFRWRRRHLVTILALALVYALLGLLCMPPELGHGIVTPSCFLPEGLALAAGLGLGPWVWPGVLLGQLWLALHRDVPLHAALLVALGNSVELLIACALFRRLGLRSDLQRLKDLVGLLLLIFLVLQPFSASIGTLALAQAGALGPDTTLMGAWQNWWIGNAISQSLLTPLVLVNLHPPAGRGRCCWQGLVSLLVIVPVAWLAFHLVNPNGTSVLLVVFTPLLVLAGVLFGLSGASAAGLGLTIVAQTMTRLGEGPFVVDGMVRILDLNTFVLGLGLTAQILAVLLGERARLEEQLRHYAFFDPLTDLPNRRMFQESFKTLQRDSERSRSWAALIFLDLDRFKQLNDSHGHPAGDRLLIGVARRLQGCLRQNDLVARLGGDEFAVILPDLGPNRQQARDQAQELLDRMAACLVEPFDLEGLHHQASASFGLRLFLGDGEPVHELMTAADTAMYDAKRRVAQGL